MPETLKRANVKVKVNGQFQDIGLLQSDVATQLASEIATRQSKDNSLEANKIPYPLNPYSKYGNPGDVLRTDGEGHTVWVPVGQPTDEQIQDAINNWLNTHPEATTTVENGSLTQTKFSDALKLQAIKDYVTPEMFGAKGNGTTDDTQAYLDMLASIPQGGTVIFTAGKTYRISITASNYITPNNLIIIAYGAIIKSIDGEDTGRTIGLRGRSYSNKCTNSYILGGTFDGNWGYGSSDDASHSPGSNTAFLIENTDNCFIKDCKIINAINDGLAGSRNTNLIIENVIIENTGEHGIYLSNSSYDKIRKCKITNPSQNTWDKASVAIKFRDCDHMEVDGYDVNITSSSNDVHLVEGSGQYFTFKNIEAKGIKGGIYLGNPTRADLSEGSGPIFMQNCILDFDATSQNMAFNIPQGTLISLSEYENITIKNANAIGSFYGNYAKNLKLSGLRGTGAYPIRIKFIDGLILENNAGYASFYNQSIIKNYIEQGMGPSTVAPIRLYDNVIIDGFTLNRTNNTTRVFAIYGNNIKILNCNLISYYSYFIYVSSSSSDADVLNLYVDNCYTLTGGIFIRDDQYAINITISRLFFESIERIIYADLDTANIKYSMVSAKTITALKYGNCTVAKITEQ